MKKVIIALSVIALLAMCGVAVVRIQEAKSRNEKAAGGGAERVPSVAVAVVEKKDVQKTVALTGVVRAENEAAVFAKMPGRITQVKVDVGQPVKPGDVLAVIDSIDLLWRVKQAEAQLAVTKAGLENARVQAQTAATSWERTQSLHKKGAVSNIELEQADAGHKMTTVGVQAAEAQVALAEAALGAANQAYSDSRITSPIAGVVAKRNVDLGAQASPAQPAFVVQNQTTLQMTGTVPAADLQLLKPGQAVKVSVEELPGRAFEGTLATVAPSLEQETRRASVKVALKPAEGLLPYMFGHAEIAFGTDEGAIVIPSAAVLSSPTGPLVYVVKDKKASVKHPQLGARIGNDVVVESGLDEGDRVITSGDTGLKDGIGVAVAGES